MNLPVLTPQKWLSLWGDPRAGWSPCLLLLGAQEPGIMVPAQTCLPWAILGKLLRAHTRPLPSTCLGQG